MLKEYHPKTIRIFSRDELKQWEILKTFNHPSLRYFIGDVRDNARVARAGRRDAAHSCGGAQKHVPPRFARIQSV